ncbi:RNA polymerase Rpb2, domain 6 [Carpediemonas membranifera]|uniref:DNA-directed RNA polymerase subunit beta n=1 Tax=Carpediemonas membranifera TaxID=201153 RepID=A0A8J6DZQ8_9EUKA|nr:RNA polymerase Rpb2, domain 6 [Carpediemonas membranifera]|eukprot:KAG9393984.1 RNA polymerase Rpb2, domain 6 [Carpediemonas membranifera]
MMTTAEEVVAEKWKLVPAFFNTASLIQHHLDSFDYFVHTGMVNIMKANQVVRCKAIPNWYLRFDNIYLSNTGPTESQGMVEDPITPMQCRLRDLTYSTAIQADISYMRGNSLVHSQGVQLGRLPIMLRSSSCRLRTQYKLDNDLLAQAGECPHDAGGYFVCKGVEKVILIQEQLSKNRIIIETDAKGDISATVTSSTHERKSRCSIVFRKNSFYLRHNSFSVDMPLVVAMKAMDVRTDQEIIQLIGSDQKYSEYLAGSLEEASRLKVFSRKQALDCIGQKMKQRMYGDPRKPHEEAYDVLHDVILNHVPVDRDNFRPKVVYLCNMVRRVIMAVRGETKMDDKDNYGNKRLELSGDMLSILFEDLFKKMCYDIQRGAETMQSKSNKAAAFDALKCIRPKNITDGFVHAISSGNWSLKRFRMERSGVTQVLSRLSYISALGMMTRMQSQFEKTRKVSGPRSLHPSTFGMLCPADTPEGESCGLVKNLALLCHITTDTNTVPLKKLVYSHGVEDCETLSGDEINNNWLVFLNGEILGVHRRPKAFVDALRWYRRHGHIGQYVSVFVNETLRSITIASDGGRVCRPLIIVEHGRSSITPQDVERVSSGDVPFSSLMRAGKIEYVDVNEENNCMIAFNEAGITDETTHVEIDPMTVLGVCAGLIPYPHHNQSPRNTYQCAMGKQAIGAIAYNQYERIDTLLYLLVYPQKPMVRTRTIEIMAFNELPAGQNATVAVMSYSGYDIEDATVLNKGSLDRGYGRCLAVRKQVTTLRQYPDSSVDVLAGRPVEYAQLPERFEKYSAIDADGLAPAGSRLAPTGTVIIHKRSPETIGGDIFPASEAPAAAAPREYRDASVEYRGPVTSHVDKMLVTQRDDEVLIKALVRDTRRPELGDKFSSRHGQKGTTGLIALSEDLPFNEQGISPDVIMNPHGFPSRMTVGKMLELVAGKAGVLHGKFGYGTVFGGTPYHQIVQDLVSRGFNYEGKDMLYSGITGELQPSYVFYGPVYYQKLKHMVQDKMHARSRGPRAMLTRQPTEGRSRDGGLRLGEMERDCLIAYGATGLITERLLTASDEYECNVCSKCGLIASEGWCQSCKSGRNICIIRLPYACKLMFQELQSMNIVPRLHLADQ